MSSLKRVCDFNVDNLSIVKSKDNKYMREGLPNLELQTAWIELDKYFVPSEKM